MLSILFEWCYTMRPHVKWVFGCLFLSMEVEVDEGRLDNN